MPRELLSHLTDHSADMVDYLKTIVELESPSTDKTLTDKLSAFLADSFGQLVDQTTPVPQTEVGDHLLARIGDGTDQLLILCHIDTVWPGGEIQARPWRVEDGRAYGPGVLDMKIGVAQTYWALKALTDLGRRPDKNVTVLFNTDEEMGSRTSLETIQAEAARARAVFCLEPSAPGGAIKIWRKGVGGFQIEVTGKASHAGSDHGSGINAIEELARQVIKVQGLTDYEVGTTVNVGLIEGGSRTNVVPDFARAGVDVRFKTPAEAERIEQTMLGLTPTNPNASIKVSGGVNRPPMEQTEGNKALFEKAKSLAGELGFELAGKGVGGGSDGNFTSAMGAPTLDGLGGVGHGAHALSEYVELAPMPLRTALLARLIETV